MCVFCVCLSSVGDFALCLVSLLGFDVGCLVFSCILEVRTGITGITVILCCVSTFSLISD